MALTAAFLEHEMHANQTTKTMQPAANQWLIQAWREQMR